jgi:4-carboxymuconolactone decarboxylase
VHLRRPSSPRIQPDPVIAEKARERMKSSAANAVNVSATMSKNRLVSRGLGKFAGSLLFEGSVPPRQRELVILRMGWNCQAVYEFGQHTLFGLEAGLTQDEIYLVTRPVSLGGWSAQDAALLQMTDDLYADDCVTDATWAELAEHFSESDIIEFIAAAGCYRAVSMFLNSAGVQLDEGVPGWPTKP